MKSLVCLLAVCTVVLAVTLEEICDTCPGLHTMCIYDGVSEECSADGAFGVSDLEKIHIVDLHNQLRNKVASGEEVRGNPGPQPSASNMRKMTWDDGLAEVAQHWADQCDYGHDTCRKDPRFPEVDNQVGQNAAYDTSCDREADWDVPITLWYGDVDNFDNSDVQSYRFLSNTGHYSQIAWAETYIIGCGFRTYTSPYGECRRYYICNYGPAGNFAGEPVYEVGEPHSACPDALFDANYPALC